MIIFHCVLVNFWLVIPVYIYIQIQKNFEPVLLQLFPLQPLFLKQLEVGPSIRKNPSEVESTTGILQTVRRFGDAVKSTGFLLNLIQS